MLPKYIMDVCTVEVKITKETIFRKDYKCKCSVKASSG